MGHLQILYLGIEFNCANKKVQIKPNQTSKTMGWLENKVEEFTSTSPIFVGPEDNLREVEKKMRQEGIRHVPVLNEGEVVGILSQRDLYIVRAVRSDQVLVKECMVTKPYAISKDDLLQDVVFQMSDRKIGSAIVLDSRRNLFGIFTTTDALNALVEIMR